MSDHKNNDGPLADNDILSMACTEIVLNDIISRVPVAMFAFDGTGRITMWNRESDKVFEVPADHAIGNPLCASIARGEDPDRIDEIVRRVFEGEVLFGVEWRWQDYADTSRNLTTIVYPAKNKLGEPQMGISVTLDYTMSRDYQRDFTSETQFRSALLNAIGVGVAIIDLHGEILFVNESLKQMMPVGPAVTMDECMERHLGESAYATVLNGGDRGECEMIVVGEDGEDVMLNVVATPMYGANNALKAVVAIFTPAPAPAKEPETNDQIGFRDMFESLTDAAAVVDSELKIKDVNKAFLALYGRRKMDVVGSPCYEVLRARSAPCHSDASNYCVIKNVLRTGTGARTHFSGNLFQGAKRSFDITASPLRCQGDECYALVVMRDVTEQDNLLGTIERAKLEWERTFDTMRDLVSIYDASHTLIRANKALASKLGVPIRDLIGRKNYEIFYGTNTSDADSAESLALRSGGTHHVTIEDEKLGHLFITVTPMLDRQGEPIGYIHVAHDLTEQKSLENQLLRAQHMENLGTLTSGIAHDFNNLLGGMLGYAKLARSHVNVEERVLKDIETIEDCARRATELTQQLLAYSRKEKPKMRKLALDRTIRGVVRIAERTMGKSIEVASDMAQDLRPVRADDNQMHHALLNLCINARDAMPDGGTITIAACNATIEKAAEAADLIEDRANRVVIGQGGVEAGNYVRVSVSDTGSGISPEIAGKIFDPFFTTKGENEGTGLGLAIIAKTLAEHGGCVVVESEVGYGTTFHLYLPEADATAESTAIHAEKADLPNEQTAGTENIMVVDDESVILSLVGDALKDAGYKLQYASSGAEAISIVKNNPGGIDLIVMDYAMPVMDGEKTFDKISELDSEIAVIIISGYNCEGKVRELVDKGVAGFLQKPFSPEQLKRTVRNVLDSGKSGPPSK